MRVLQGYLPEPIPNAVDIVVANLPYLPEAELEERTTARDETRPVGTA